MGYSQDHPAIPSQDHPSSTNGLSIPLSLRPHASPRQSPRRLSPAADEPSSLPSPSVLSGLDRPFLPTRASTLGSAHELDNKSSSDPSLPKYSRSEDLNHTSVLTAPSPSFLSASRPTTPGSSSRDRNPPSSFEYSSTSTRRLSGASVSSQSTSSSPVESRPPLSVTSGSSATLVSCVFFLARTQTLSLRSYPLSPPPLYTSQTCLTKAIVASPRTCSACLLPMHGAFVRALSTVFHLQCFKCIVCAILFIV
jgi:hypothetical protein